MWEIVRRRIKKTHHLIFPLPDLRQRKCAASAGWRWTALFWVTLWGGGTNQTSRTNNSFKRVIRSYYYSISFPYYEIIVHLSPNSTPSWPTKTIPFDRGCFGLMCWSHFVQTHRPSQAKKNYMRNRELLFIKLGSIEWRHCLEEAKQPFVVWQICCHLSSAVLVFMSQFRFPDPFPPQTDFVARSAVFFFNFHILDVGFWAPCVCVLCQGNPPS